MGLYNDCSRASDPVLPRVEISPNRINAVPLKKLIGDLSSSGKKGRQPRDAEFGPCLVHSCTRAAVLMIDRLSRLGSDREARMSFRRAPEARILVSLAGLIAAALLIVAAAVYLGSVQQDKLQKANEQRAVALRVDSLKRALVTTVRDYAWWNNASPLTGAVPRPDMGGH